LWRISSIFSEVFMAGALDGLRVIDLSRILAGPFASQTLADMGAYVLKVEHPLGDDTRRWGPPFVQRANQSVDAAYFFCCNRNKTSLCVDFTNPDDCAQLIEQTKAADVLIENYKVGGLKQYGLDYASMRALNPRLIYCSITGFGQTGPYKNRPGYDALIQGMGGLMSITGEADGAPQKVGVAVVDLMTGLYASTAILAALHHVRMTGQGQHIDLALFDVQAAMLANQAASYLASGVVPMRKGSSHPSIAPYQPIQVRDGFVMLAVGNERQFKALCEAIERVDLMKDARFCNNEVRVLHRVELENILTQAMHWRTIDEWTQIGAQGGFPCGPINTIDKVLSDPQIIARNMVITNADGVQMVANPIRFSATPIETYVSPPTLNQG
jgi:crotonobetainyl-CoA:carnitine CoA-transferase CaiB-like acyl-CoA transferase